MAVQFEVIAWAAVSALLISGGVEEAAVLCSRGARSTACTPWLCSDRGARRQPEGCPAMQL